VQLVHQVLLELLVFLEVPARQVLQVQLDRWVKLVLQVQEDLLEIRETLEQLVLLVQQVPLDPKVLQALVE